MEYKIESALANIDDKWKKLELVMEEHKKGGYYKIKKPYTTLNLFFKRIIKS
jgi:hypothetical protein